jgi:hypothetical protein
MIWVVLALALVVAPPLSVTFRTVLKTPGVAYVCETVAPVADVPSPKLH